MWLDERFYFPDTSPKHCDWSILKLKVKDSGMQEYTETILIRILGGGRDFKILHFYVCSSVIAFLYELELLNGRSYS